MARGKTDLVKAYVQTFSNKTAMTFESTVLGADNLHVSLINVYSRSQLWLMHNGLWLVGSLSVIIESNEKSQASPTNSNRTALRQLSRTD